MKKIPPQVKIDTIVKILRAVCVDGNIQNKTYLTEPREFVATLRAIMWVCTEGKEGELYNCGLIEEMETYHE